MNDYIAYPVEHISYEKYLFTLVSEAHCRDIPIEIIGEEKSEFSGITYPLYKIVINPEKQENICIVAGVHGNEIAGPLSILRLIQMFRDELSDKYRYIIYPMVNPTGFDLRQRFDDDYDDLNAIYSDTLNSKNYGEVQAVVNDLQKYDQFVAFMALHEDTDVDQFYMYGIGEENVPFYHRLCTIANNYCTPWKNAEIYGLESDEVGLIHANCRDHAFETYFILQKDCPIGFTFETPGKIDLSTRLSMMVETMVSTSHLLAGDYE